MQPSIGRIVHYTNHVGTTQAAIITGINDNGSVSLHVFARGDHFMLSSVPFAEFAVANYWNWPPRV